ncbi:MAG: hypothetical protein E7589_01390 [Ruminococcaceae bacterium]|nr:hypothetical protein [Oscillospiraceae bacterium]
MSTKRLTRAQIDEWYAGCPIPRRGGMVFRALENDGRLILGVYKDKKQMGVYVLNPDGRYCSRREGSVWCSGGIYSIFEWSTYWYQAEAHADKKIRWATAEDERTGEELLDEHNRYVSCKPNIIRRLREIESQYNENRRTSAAERKMRRIQNYIDTIPDEPEDFEKWCHEVVMGGMHYMFGKAGEDVYFCTSCGSKHIIKGLKDRQRTECPITGARVKVEKSRELVERHETVMLLQSMPDGKEAVARHISVWFDWSAKDGMRSNWGDNMVVVLPKDGRTSAYKWYYHLCGGFFGGTWWDDRNKANYTPRREYCYPYTVKDALANTVYEHLGLDVAAARGWRLSYNRLMMAWRYGQTEYLIKGGFERLVGEISDRCHVGLYAGCICEVGRDVKETLMLDGQRVARLRRADGGIGYLRWLRYEAETEEKIPEELLCWLGDNIEKPSDLNFALERMSAVKVGNYLRAQVKEYKRKTSSVIESWKDYLGMAKRLKLDTKKDMIFRPKHLKARHDELAEIISAKADELERERIEAQYPAVVGVCDRIRPLYEWTDEKYRVIVPAGAADIIREGRLLRHCVGSTDRYFDRIAEGESYIMFLRKCSDADAPWYTMEVEPGGKVRQLRTFGDDEGSDRPEAKEALGRWQKEIFKRLKSNSDGERELEAAEVSRERRIAEFEELRRNGNIIRNGRFAGRLLVEILEADFKEYNEQAAV